MKKYIISFILGGLMLCSCDKMFEPKTIQEVGDDQMWVVWNAAQGVLMNAYQAMPNRPHEFNNNYLDVATDNAVTNSFDTAIYRLSQGDVTSSNCPIACWGEAYQQFQNIHLFLNKGLGEATHYSTDDATNTAIRKRLVGEAYYLRAWWGARLLQFYGGRTLDGKVLGYPIVTEFVTTEEAKDYSWIKRDSYDDCVAQICADCDAASAILPATSAEVGINYEGRATKQMAEFLKARVLFLAANPAFQPESIVKINGMADYTVVDESAYKAKWNAAIEQLWKVINLTGQTSYVALQKGDLVDMDPNNIVKASHFISQYYFQSNGLETQMFPPFYFGNANTLPSQNLVDAYPMKANGYPISDPLSGYNDQDPYAGRDDRLELTIYHQGSEFQQAGRISASLTPEEGSYIDVVYGGKDSESFMNGGSRGTRTGYYLHKGLSEKKDMLLPTQTVNGLHFYPTMRMAEIYLDLAEALNESVGPTGTYGEVTVSAYDIIKDIRKKSGGIVDDQYIETVKGSKADFTDLILNERRLEFAFEGFRYWDLRRRLLPLSGTVTGMEVTKKPDGTLNYAVKDVEKRDFNALRFYYLPIPYAECKKNEGMINNMDY